MSPGPQHGDAVEAATTTPANAPLRQPLVESGNVLGTPYVAGAPIPLEQLVPITSDRQSAVSVAGIDNLAPFNELLQESLLPTAEPARQINLAAAADGAVVVAANPEAKKPDKCIDSDVDSFMKNECEAKKWLIIELSQLGTVETVQLTMKEMYSGRIRVFRVKGRQTHPRRDGAEYTAGFDSKSWELLGEFVAENRRGTQSFGVPQKKRVRYVLFMFDSQYGNERMCALNSIQLLGVSAAKELEEALSSQFANEAEVDDNLSAGGNIEEGTPPASSAATVSATDGSTVTGDGDLGDRAVTVPNSTSVPVTAVELINASKADALTSDASCVDADQSPQTELRPQQAVVTDGLCVPSSFIDEPSVTVMDPLSIKGSAARPLTDPSAAVPATSNPMGNTQSSGNFATVTSDGDQILDVSSAAKPKQAGNLFDVIKQEILQLKLDQAKATKKLDAALKRLQEMEKENLQLRSLHSEATETLTSVNARIQELVAHQVTQLLVQEASQLKLKMHLLAGSTQRHVVAILLFTITVLGLVLVTIPKPNAVTPLYVRTIQLLTAIIGVVGIANIWLMLQETVPIAPLPLGSLPSSYKNLSRTI